MKPELMRNRVTFQRTDDDRKSYTDVLSCRAYINGVSGDEFFIANGGDVGALTVTISCRYQSALMAIDPTVCRAADEKGNVYELLSPADDKMGKHTEIIFRARRFMFDVQERP